MELVSRPFKIDCPDRKTIYGDIRYPPKKGKFPAMIVLHGFKAWKDWGFYPYVCSQIAASGAISINFSTSHCGVSPESDKIDLTEDFASNTASREIEDCERVINEFNSGKFGQEIVDRWNGDLYFLGHSRGGALGIAIAAENKIIKKLIAWSPIEKFVRFSPRQIIDWKEKGQIEFHDNQSGENLKIYRTYIDDIEMNAKRLDPNLRARELEIPVCIIHGRQDMTVRYNESENIFRNVISDKPEYYIIERTGHTFGINHPFEKTNAALEEVLKHTINFINRK